jgi:hypothetical protein
MLPLDSARDRKMKTVPLYGKRIMRSGNMGRIFNIDVANGQPPTGTNRTRRPNRRIKAEG